MKTLFIGLLALALLGCAAVVPARLTKSSQTPTPGPTDTRVPPLTTYPRVGNQRRSSIRPKGPVLALMGGGGEVPAAFRFMHDAVAGSRTARAVDLIVLRASGDNDYDSDVMKFAPFNSVQTIVIGRGARASELSKAAALIERAQAIFIAGGDQANYVRWKGTRVISAVQGVYDRGGAVGGTSAGLAVLGEYVFDSVGPMLPATTLKQRRRTQSPILQSRSSASPPISFRFLRCAVLSRIRILPRAIGLDD